MAPPEFVESREEMERILDEELVGYLGLSGEGGPYVVPLNYAYADGRIWFHCAWEGEKLDHLGANPRVCFAVARQSGPVRRHAEGDPCHTDNDSVICRGTARIVEDLEERKQVLNAFNRSFDAGAEPITDENAAKCCAVEIELEEMTGRRERAGGERTFWRHRFR